MLCASRLDGLKFAMTSPTYLKSGDPAPSQHSEPESHLTQKRFKSKTPRQTSIRSYINISVLKKPQSTISNSSLSPIE